MTNNAIIIVDDDSDDSELLSETLKEIGVSNEIRCFKNAVVALDYLRKTSETPFIIISDINMPEMNGLEFKKNINEDIFLKRKEIPFVFLSTSKEHSLLEKAFKLSIQGYFQKANNINTFKEIVQAIIGYWKRNSLTYMRL